jgi:hypothetical protein
MAPIERYGTNEGAGTRGFKELNMRKPNKLNMRDSDELNMKNLDKLNMRDPD